MSNNLLTEGKKYFVLLRYRSLTLPLWFVIKRCYPKIFANNLDY